MQQLFAASTSRVDFVKMKDQVLIVNGMTNEIVDMFSETQSIS